MKKFLIAGALLAGLSAPAFAQSLSIGGGFQNGVSQTANAAASIGNAAAASLSSANNTSIGTGIAATSPAGNVTAGLGASVGNTASVGAAASGPGAGIAAAQRRWRSVWGRPRLRLRQLISGMTLGPGALPPAVSRATVRRSGRLPQSSAPASASPRPVGWGFPLSQKILHALMTSYACGPIAIWRVRESRTRL